MRLTILGGGGFRVPLVYGALLGDRHQRRVETVTLYDTDPARLAAMAHVLAQLAAEHQASDGTAGTVAVRTSTDLDDAIAGADVVFSAMRVGGLAGRTCDERVALDLGVLGQETTGPGGIAYGLRTIPVAVDVARRVRELAPTAYLINFTNPAGMITEAMATELGDRVIGICDSPIGLARRAARSVGADLGGLRLDYLGLNHLGWLRGMYAPGLPGGPETDLLADVLASDEALAAIEEGRLFGADWVRTLGALPNEYLYYWYFTRDAIAAIRGSAQTRGEFLLDQQSAFYAAVAADPDSALAIWRRSRDEREATYLAETREATQERDQADLAGGGYEAVALALMAAISRNEPAQMILNVRAGYLVPGLAPDAVVEVPCAVDAAGVHPLPVTPLTGASLGLVQQVKAVERTTIRAALERSPRLAVAAFAEHPLVDSVTVARQLLAGYRARIPQVAALFDADPS